MAATEVHLDALPYIDHGYDEPGVREEAMKLVEEETKRYRPNKSYLDYLQQPKVSFETPMLRTEFERLSMRQPMEMLSMKRYELPQPGVAQKNDIGAWQESVDNSMAQLEHQAGRIINLELLSQYSSNEWKEQNGFITRMIEQEQKTLKKLRNQVQEVNWERKTKQMTAGGHLHALENHWQSLVQKNYEIERVCLNLEQEVGSLRQQAIDRGLRVSEDLFEHSL
ncbi:pre-mRNA-splicing factor SPF27-like [Halichondria panicea]|uniref:pre-mRNA-splicing factor SPF27-like n=1 Tax=Halichondria panicea TaxID=6063 RepID=UPI00312BC731